MSVIGWGGKALGAERKLATSAVINGARSRGARTGRNLARRQAGTTARATRARSAVAAARPGGKTSYIGPSSRFHPGKPRPPKILPPAPRTGFNKMATDASQWAKGHKGIIAGAGGIALAGTAFSNNTGPGSPKGTPNQARGVYGF